jgi:hypothetical protein
MNTGFIQRHPTTSLVGTLHTQRGGRRDGGETRGIGMVERPAG